MALDGAHQRALLALGAQGGVASGCRLAVDAGARIRLVASAVAAARAEVSSAPSAGSATKMTSTSLT